MAFILGIELLDTLPRGTSVSESEAQGFIDASVARLSESHAPSSVPENALTRDLIEQMAYARAMERHYLKGEGAIEVPAAKDAIQRAEAAFLAYDVRHTSVEEQAAESPKAYITKVSW